MPARVINSNFIKTGLICPPDKAHIEFTSSDRDGLYIEVRATSPGQGTYWWRYKDQGKTARVRIGLTTDISVKEAKSQVRTLRAQRDLGRNPAAEIKAKKQSMSWNDFFTNRYYPYIISRKRSNRNDQNIHDVWISPTLGDKRLDRITRHQIEQLHQSMLDQGRAASTCNHLIKIMRRAYNLAIEWDLVQKNPAEKIKAFPEDNKRQRILSADELQRLTAVLKADKNRTVCNVVLFLLSTGARVSEALKADWDHIDRKGRTWTIPVSNSKSKRLRMVPLNDSAMRVLDDLGTEGKSPHLFTNKRTGNRLTTITKVWDRLRNKAGMPDLRLHDLRHTMASLMVNAGVSIYEVQKILGHSDVSVTERYSHLAPETLQKASTIAGDQILAALETAA